MRVVSLFAGIGGFDLAFKNNGHEIVYANEWDAYASRIYAANFGLERLTEKRIEGRVQGHSTNPICQDGNGGQQCSNDNRYIGEKGEILDCRDITTVDAREIPEHDIICGGFPCQAFSIAGKRLGFNDTRGNLFFEIMRIAKHHRSPYLILENVKGLLNHDNGKTFGTILSFLDECGYDAQWQVLNSKNFGVPQNRERVFIVANIRGITQPKVFPFTKDDGQIGNLQGHSTNTITSRYYNAQDVGSYIVENQQHQEGEVKSVAWRTRMYRNEPGHFEVRDDDIANQLTTVQKDSMILSEDKPKIIEDFYPGRVLEFEDSPTLRGDRSGLKVTEGTKIRRLTPVECERLQGFPDGWTSCVSDSHRYKCLGNAVTVNVVDAIVKKFNVALMIFKGHGAKL